MKSKAEEFIKTPNVSGQFYPEDSKELSKEVDDFINKAQVSAYDNFINMIIVPHAGYFYSGAVAGYGFKALNKQTYKTVIILAPSHFFGFDGISIWSKGAFETPLGKVSIDEEITKDLIGKNEKFIFEPKAFDREHALEVEIPFVQKTFPDAKIVAVIVGQPTAEVMDQFALTLKLVIGNRKDVLIVVSTDLSHYHDDKTARKMDEKTLTAVKNLNLESLWQGHDDQTMEMCGIMPVSVGILYAHHQGLNQVDQLRYANSGDVSGDKNRVVGYSALAVYAK